MLDTIIVAAIIAVAAFFVGRRLYRTFSGKQAGCGCGQSGSCGCSQSGACGSDLSGSDQKDPGKSSCCGCR